METHVVNIKNLASKQDANKILNALEHVWGNTRAEVNLSRGQAIFSYDEKMASLHDFEQAIIESGFEISPREDYYEGM